MATVMVVDDEERIRGLLARSLSTEGHTVLTAATAGSAIDRLGVDHIDLILLDLVMPGPNGLTVLHALSERQDHTPVIVLSGVTDVGARVQALDQGAVDVVAKPFSMTELLARVRRNIGQVRPAGDEHILSAAGIRLDLGRRRATLRDRAVLLTEREIALLAHLMRRVGEVCPREELLHDVWQLDFEPGTNIVEACVARLRSKLGPGIAIETVRGIGYCLSED
jgi:DNA-binding response OmpR family regulator